MTIYFVDTSYLLALELANDQNHQYAISHWQKLTSKSLSLVTTSYIFDEVMTYFNSRGHHAKAKQLGNLLLQNPSINLIHVEEPLFMAGWHYFLQRPDKRYSLTDCISFVVMQQHNLQIALTFDHHFSQAGFQLEP
jgi:uncharacterized protein